VPRTGLDPAGVEHRRNRHHPRTLWTFSAKSAHPRSNRVMLLDTLFMSIARQFIGKRQISPFARRFFGLLSLPRYPAYDALPGVNGLNPQEHTMKTFSRRAAIGLIAMFAAFCATIPSPYAQDASLAIKGYDPVAYFTDGKPVPGSPEFEYKWDDHTYRFASAAHRDMFKAEPVRYAPQFGNFCAMALSKGQIVVANPENWLISDGKLYVFGSPAPAGPALFQKNLAENTTKANQNRSMLPK
jgi:hypothetical protein